MYNLATDRFPHNIFQCLSNAQTVQVKCYFKSPVIRLASESPNKLSSTIDRYRLYGMRFRNHTFRAAVASGLSLWMAALACLLGCALPSSTNTSDLIKTPSIQENLAGPSQPDLLANMENCPHHSASNAPGKQSNRKPVRGGMSCCPVEVTVATKPVTVVPQVNASRDFVLNADFSSMTVRFFQSMEFVPPLLRSGRDTLLETQLLRI
jgi:hypothetical protein